MDLLENHRVTSSVIKMSFFAHGGISIKLFVMYLHIINECLSYKFHPYSILTGHTKVESVAYQVLRSIQVSFQHFSKPAHITIKEIFVLLQIFQAMTAQLEMLIAALLCYWLKGTIWNEKISLLCAIMLQVNQKVSTLQNKKKQK